MDFSADKTIIVMFDTEWYVPENTRPLSLSSLKSNPLSPKNQYIGGVFYRFYPVRDNGQKLEKKEIFVNSASPEDENQRLKETCNYFKESWNLLEGKSDLNPDLITIGIGNSRFDLPSLYARSVHLRIEDPKTLFETYLKTKCVDLSDVAIPYVNKNRPKLMYPVSTNTMISRFGLKSEKKESGKAVWEMFEAGDFEGIRTRVRGEVMDIWKIYNKLISNIFSN